MSVNSVAWAPWEYGLKLAACSSDGCISYVSRRGELNIVYFSFNFNLKR